MAQPSMVARATREPFFKLDTGGTESVLYNFTGGADGSFPNQWRHTRCCRQSLWHNLRWQPWTPQSLEPYSSWDNSGHQTTLYKFTGGGDGQNPTGSLFRDASGNLYGVTQTGGINCVNGCGTVYKLDHSGHHTVLYTFTGAPTDPLHR